jgi:hypothetical protein
MKKLKTYIFSGIILMFLILAYSCSKEEENIANPDTQKSETIVMDKTFANGMHGNQFANGKFNSVLTHFNGMANFATSGGGNNNFAGSGGGSGSGGNGTGSGSFSLNGTTYPILFGGFESFDDGWFEILFLDETMGNNITGANAVAFDILSPSENEITSGIYNYSESYNPFTFDWGIVDLNIETGYEEYYEIVGGSITISKSGNSYSINFNGLLEGGGSVSGFYSGILVDMDEQEPPPPTRGMSANIDGQSWVAEYAVATLDTQYGFLSISGYRNDQTSISFELDESMIYTGAQLTLSNEGVYYINCSFNGYYYAESYGIVNITSYNSSSISGTFSFNAINYSEDPISVTNGVFTNIPIY